MKYIVKKFTHPLRGLCVSLTKDRGVQFQLMFFVITAPTIYLLFKPLEYTEVGLILFGYGLLFVTELQNTALETALDHLHPERHEHMRNSKDIAASSVLVSLLVFASLVVLLWTSRP